MSGSFEQLQAVPRRVRSVHVFETVVRFLRSTPAPTFLALSSFWPLREAHLVVGHEGILLAAADIGLLPDGSRRLLEWSVPALPSGEKDDVNLSGRSVASAHDEPLVVAACLRQLRTHAAVGSFQLAADTALLAAQEAQRAEVAPFLVDVEEILGGIHAVRLHFPLQDWKSNVRMVTGSANNTCK